MAGALEKLLLNSGPRLSSELCRTLTRRYGFSPAAARQQVSRAKGDVRRLSYLPFPRNARFIYHKRHFGSERYWDRLIQALLRTGSAYGLALAALKLRGGILPVAHFVIACGSPIRQKKHLSAETVLARLKRAKLIDEYLIPGVGRCIALIQGAGRYDDARSAVQARLITEGILLSAIKTWLQNLGLVSFEKVAIRDRGALPRVGTFAWDISAPCYLGAFVNWSKSGAVKPGFVMCDVMLGTHVDEEGLHPFIHKTRTLRSLRGVGRSLQMFVASTYSRKAFLLAKRTGIIPATPETLFGEEIARGLTRLFEVLKYAANFSTEPEQFAELFERLGRIEGAAANLRGALFEYMVAAIARQSQSARVTNNKVVRLPNGAQAEVDVLIEEGHRVVTFIECKGYQPYGIVPDEYIDAWLTKRIPTVYEYARQHPDWRSLQLRFEFWTTGTVSKAARQKIKKATRTIRPTRYTVALLEADAVVVEARKTQDISLIKTLKTHFIEHPMAKRVLPVERRHLNRPRSLANKELEADPMDEDDGGRIVMRKALVEPVD